MRLDNRAGSHIPIFFLPKPVPILSEFPALIVHSELKSVHPGFPVAFIFKHKLINK